MRHYNTFHFMGDIARRLYDMEASPPDLQNVKELSNYLGMFYDRQYLDPTGLYLRYGFSAGQVMLHARVERDGFFTLEIRSQGYQNAEIPLFRLMISEGAIAVAHADQVGMERVEYDLESLDMIFEFVIPALGGFEDILTVTDPNTVHMLRLVGAAYAQRELARLLNEDAGARCIDDMQALLDECRNLDIQYTLKRRRVSV